LFTQTDAWKDLMALITANAPALIAKAGKLLEK